MRQELLMVEFYPIIKNLVSYSINGDRDGFSPSKYSTCTTEKVQVGTSIRFHEVNPKEPIDKFQEEVRNGMELKAKLPSDFKLEIPNSREFWINPKFVSAFPKKVETTRIFKKEEFLVLVHNGISGCYISNISEERAATMHFHNNKKYGVDSLSIKSSTIDITVEFAIKSVFSMLFKDDIDFRNSPTVEEAETFIANKTKNKPAFFEETESVWDVLKNIK